MSLAGRPPYATDEPDSFYESSPTPRRNPPVKPEDPNKRTSAYNMYDNYLSEADNKSLSPSSQSESQANRISGVSNLGMGLLNMADDSDSDDDSEDEAEQRRRRVASAAGRSPSKHAALAAATQSSSATRRQPSPTPQQGQQQQQKSPQQQQQTQQQQQQQPPQQQQRSPPQQQQQPPQQQQQQRPPPQQQQQPPQQQQQQQRPPQQQQQPRPPQSLPGQQPRPLQPIAAPRPGYAAPIAALNLAQPPPSLPPTGLGRLPPTSNPFDSPPPPFPSSPSPSSPHPLQPPMTPIKPIFALPSSSPSSPPSPGSPSITFNTPTPRKPIIRSNSEDPLLPTRGEKGDDFWRRFSIIAKEDLAKPRGSKESSWLKKTQSGSVRLNTWVGVVAVLLIASILAAVGLGIYFNRNAPGHQQPKVFGGSADEVGSSVSSSASASATSVKKSVVGTASSSLHVSPTFTVARRAGEEEPQPTFTGVPVPRMQHRMYRRKAGVGY